MESWQLKQLQGLPYEVKIKKTQQRIQEFYEYYNGEVYISFSGGKDSTVLLEIAREMYPDIKAVFLDTWMEYPEVREIVKKYDNVERIKPKKKLKEIIDEYGWNFPSKDVAECVYYARKGSKWALNKLNGLNSDGSYSEFKQQYKKWSKLLEAPFKISNKCCIEMKENPVKEFEKKTGLKPIMAIMASESERRKQAYLKTGCNAFDIKRPNSKPMGFWTEQDVLRYIKTNNVEIAKVYGEITECYGKISLPESCKLCTTGEDRTGCMFCPVGCHLDKFGKYRRLKETHPNIYNYFMEELGLKDVLQWIKDNYNVKGDF